MTQPKALKLAEALDKSVLSVCAEAAAELRRLHAALDEAREMVIHWGSYASEYMQKKYKLQEDIDELTEALK